MRRKRALFLAVAAGLLGTLATLPAPAGGTFPGGSGKIAFEAITEGQFDIYVMEADGTGLTNLTSHPARDRDAAWSPDGTRIAFSSNRDGDAEIYVMNADGTGLTRLTDSRAADTDPGWSPDGAQIVFVSDRAGRASDIGESNEEIWVMEADGSHLKRLTKNTVADDDPAFSPDGRSIAFSRLSGQSGFEIWVMDADGRRERQLTAARGDDEHPSWSPDGARIAFSSQRDGGTGLRGGGTGRIYVMQADGSEEAPVTGSTRDLDPVWSPDGARIAFASTRNGTAELFAVAADGRELVRLAAPAGGLEPDWQPFPPARPADGCTIRGTAGDDELVGTAGPDVICGYGGNDTLKGRGGADELRGGPGDDTLLGGRGRDVADGGPGKDTCKAEKRVAC